MSGLAATFPLLVLLAILVVLVLLFRLDRRLSRGSVNAGPREPVPAETPGLLETPWELQAIDNQLSSPPGARNRADLIKTVNRLVEAGGIENPAARLAPDAGDHQIALVVAELERRLELGPIDQRGQ